MLIRRFDRSIEQMPRLPGTFWVRALDSTGRPITIDAGYSVNVWLSLVTTDKRAWFLPDATKYWVEVLLDLDIAMSA